MKIIFLYAKAGAGHLTVAKALAKKSSEMYGPSGVEVALIDGLQGRFKLDIIVEHLYSILTNHFPWLWKAIYWVSQSAWVLNISFLCLRWVIYRDLYETISKVKPDKIVSVYYFAPVLRRILKDLQRDIPVATVVADPFTFHPIWLHDNCYPAIVFTNDAKSRAVQYGFSEKNLKIFGPVVRDLGPKLDVNRQQEVKEQIGLDPTKKTALIVGGGDGLPGGIHVLRKLVKSTLPIQYLFVAGRNHHMQKAAQVFVNKRDVNNVFVYGYVENLPDFMKVVDLVITKGGPGIMYEVIGVQKPAIITSYIWQQEQGNVQYLVDNHVGYFVPNTNQIVSKVSEVLNSDKLLRWPELHSGTTHITQYIVEEL